MFNNFFLIIFVIISFNGANAYFFINESFKYANSINVISELSISSCQPQYN